MKKACLMTALLTLTSAAQAASLAEQLPSGALLTVETRNASGLVERLSGLVAQVAQTLGVGSLDDDALGTAQSVLNDSVANEAVLGIFAVGQEGKPFTPQVLAVSKVAGNAADIFTEDMKKPTAFVGQYGFTRSGKVFSGSAKGLVYFATDKNLLMAYLGRLSGKDAPRLLSSAAYTKPTRAIGQQEVSLFMNFSASAKVLRSQLAKMYLPRLLSPVVDAIDTLGHYAGGFTTTDAGLSGVSALVANAQGKDQPLYRILTHATTFKVQDIIPADAEAVQASACEAGSSAYLGRWLTRLDLFEPLGFLTDSQLASHLERSSRYLGDECARVTLAGGTKAALSNQKNMLASLDYSVSYQRVTDLQAAKAHMPEYAQSFNKAVQGVAETLGPLLGGDAVDQVSSFAPGGMAGAAAAGSEAAKAVFKDLGDSLNKLKMVYAFRDDYLIVAYSEEALKQALDETKPALAQDADFQAAGLSMQSAGWSYQRDWPEFTEEEVQGLFANALDVNKDAASTEDMAVDPTPDDPMTDEEMADEDRLTDEEQEELDAMLAALEDGQVTAKGTPDMEQFAGLMTNLMNRYDGLVAQKEVSGNMVVTKTSLKYRWTDE